MSEPRCGAQWETTDPRSRRGSRLAFTCTLQLGHDGKHSMRARGHTADLERIAEVTW